MEIKSCVTGELDENCYCLYSGQECCIVDPGADAEKIEREFGLDGLKVKYILLTHAHFDHIGAVEQISAKYGAQICIHEADAMMLEHADRNMSVYMVPDPVQIKADVILRDGDVLNVGGTKIKAVHTPGHTPGGLCYIAGDAMFSGDTLFMLSVGRSDFPGGNQEDLMHSVRIILFGMQTDYTVYPGHGDSTTLFFEKENNPYR